MKKFWRVVHYQEESDNPNFEGYKTLIPVYFENLSDAQDKCRELLDLKVANLISIGFTIKERDRKERETLDWDQSAQVHHELWTLFEIVVMRRNEKRTERVRKEVVVDGKTYSSYELETVEFENRLVEGYKVEAIRDVLIYEPGDDISAMMSSVELNEEFPEDPYEY